jgi:hypothetical protein
MSKNNAENVETVERVRIQRYSLFDFIKELEVKILEGFRVSNKSGDFPTGFVNFFSCQLVKPLDVETEKEGTSELKQESLPSKSSEVLEEVDQKEVSSESEIDVVVKPTKTKYSKTK